MNGEIGHDTKELTPTSEWVAQVGWRYSTNGYARPPWQVYRALLPEIDRLGRVLELGCGNGLLLRFLVDFSRLPEGHRIDPFGADLNRDAIREAQEDVFPERPKAFKHADLRDDLPFAGPFCTILANPLYADPGYYEQVEGRIPALQFDGGIERLVGRCWAALGSGGKLVFWCYEGHANEVSAQWEELRLKLISTGVSFKEAARGPVFVWLSDEK